MSQRTPEPEEDRSRRSLSAFVAAAVLAAGSMFPHPLRAQGRAGSEACLECHEHVSLQGSSHVELSCAECHQGLVQRAGSLPHQAVKDLPPPTCASGSCHKEPPEARTGGTPTAYPDSVHGRAYLERHEPEVARCWDCHGRHDIKAVADPEAMVSRRNIPLMCSRCHEDMSVVLKYNIHAESPYQEYRESVHGRALYDKGLLDFAAVCTDCHGVHDIQGVGAAHLPAKDPSTCGKCHRLVLEEYARSVHGRDALKGNVDVPLCVDCHGEHSVAAAASPAAPTSKSRVPDTCSACHSRAEIMKKYGVPEDRIKTFIDSFHGIAIGLGGTAEASCVDCHGVHDILPAADPASKVHPANLAGTCGRASCHPSMPEKIAGAKIHRDYDQARSGAPFYFRKALVWAVFLLTALTLVFFIPALVRRRRGASAP